MSPIDVHPEHLVDRVRRGEASSDERTRLQEHLAMCPACRFEVGLAGTLDLEAEVLFGDPHVMQRVWEGTRERLFATGSAARGTVTRRRRRTLVALAAAAIVSGGLGWAAALGSDLLRPTEAAPSTAVAVTPAAPPSVAAVAVDPPSPALEAQPSPSPSSSAAAATDTKRAPQRSASELFSEANAARRSGAGQHAAGLYRELQHVFPRSSEAALSRVTLGRLLLDRLSAPAGALREFDAYLASASRGSLREEALVGRALALGRLGRTTEESAAWQALLMYNPNTTYAEHARRRAGASAQPPPGRP
jgi:hypothetical protein